jgi:hypothetical protein
MKKIAALFCFLLFLLPPVAADGMMIVQDLDMWSIHPETAQYAAINYQDGQENLLLAVAARPGPNSTAAVWIVPVPAPAGQVKVDIIPEFPQFNGQNVEGDYTGSVISGTALAAGYATFPFSIFAMFPLMFGFGMAGSTTGITQGTSIEGITIHSVVQRQGVTSELVSAASGDDMDRFLLARGLVIPADARPMLDGYVGKQYSFVVTRISDMKQFRSGTGITGISVSFPTQEIYFPLEPTRVYGARKVPVILYVTGFVTPRTYDAIVPGTTITYYREDDYTPPTALVPFFGGQKTIGNLQYTRIKISVPSDAFTSDLWIDTKAPPGVTFHDEFLRSSPYLWILLFALFSMLASLGAGTLVLQENPVSRGRLLRHGLWNLLTFVLMAAMTSGLIPESRKKERSRYLVIFYSLFLSMLFLTLFVLLPSPPGTVANHAIGFLQGLTTAVSGILGGNFTEIFLFILILFLLCIKLYRWVDADHRQIVVVAIPGLHDKTVPRQNIVFAGFCALFCATGIVLFVTRSIQENTHGMTVSIIPAIMGAIFESLILMLVSWEALITIVLLVIWILDFDSRGHVCIPWYNPGCHTSAKTEDAGPGPSDGFEPYLAVILSVMLPGLGLVWQGRYLSAILVFSSFIAAVICFPTLALLVLAIGAAWAYAASAGMIAGTIPYCRTRADCAIWMTIAGTAILLILAISAAGAAGSAPGNEREYPHYYSVNVTGTTGTIQITSPEDPDVALPLWLNVSIGSLVNESWEYPEPGESRTYLMPSGAKQHVVITAGFSPGENSVVADRDVWPGLNTTWLTGDTSPGASGNHQAGVRTEPVISTWQKLGPLPTLSYHDNHPVIRFNNSILMLDGDRIWSSEDGRAWSSSVMHADLPNGDGYRFVVFNDRLWLIGSRFTLEGIPGYRNDIWYSADGIAWTKASGTLTGLSRGPSEVLIYNNRMWLIGGNTWNGSASVWSSADGETWNQETDSAGFLARSYPHVLTFGNRIWVIGGMGDPGQPGPYGGTRVEPLNDTWTSTDGRNWQQVMTKSAFIPRDNEQAFVYDNRIWVLGGNAQDTHATAWSTTDGITWTKTATDLPATAGMARQTAVFPDHLVLIDAIGGNAWVSPPGSVHGCIMKDIGTFSGDQVFSVPYSNEGELSDIRVWEFGNRYMGVIDEKNYIGGGGTRDFRASEFSKGRNMVLFQSAGSPDGFDIEYNTDTGEVFKNSGRVAILFRYPNYLAERDPGLAQNLLDAFDDPEVHDRCTAYTFTVR